MYIANAFKPVDWLRVSTTLIAKGGGSGLLKIHKGSLVNALKQAFPYEDWDSLEKPLANFTQPHSFVHDALHHWIPMHNQSSIK